MNLIYTTLPEPSGFRPDKHSRPRRAHAAVFKSRREFKIHTSPCCICGDVNAVAHHDDYTQPFRVAWLCNAHHRQRHVELGWGVAIKGKVGGIRKREEEIPLLVRISRAAAKKAILEHIKIHGSRTAAARVLGVTTETLRQKLAAK